jgi:hypothetical protein
MKVASSGSRHYQLSRVDTKKPRIKPGLFGELNNPYKFSLWGELLFGGVFKIIMTIRVLAIKAETESKGIGAITGIIRLTFEQVPGDMLNPARGRIREFTQVFH